MKTFTQLLDEKYGPQGTPARDLFDAESLAFREGVMRKCVKFKLRITN